MNSKKDIPGFEGLYSITTDGRVWSHYKNIWMKQGIDRKGYKHLVLWDGRKYTHFWTARLVMKTYAKPHPKKKFIDHINCIKTDNRLVNLQWTTRAENTHLAWVNGRHTPLSGELNPNSKLTIAKVKKIRERYASGGIFRQQLGKEYKVARQTIDDIVNRKIWKEVL